MADKKSLCNYCNSKSYCPNREPGVIGCENFNKFAKPEGSEPRPSYSRR